MMTLARKPSKACSPQATQATVGRFKARLQARQDWAAGTSRLGCKHAKARLQAHQDWAASTPNGEKEFSAPRNGARCTSQRSTLHQPSQHAASPIAPPYVFPPDAERRAGLLPYPFPTTASAAGGKWCESGGKPLPVPAKSSTFAHTELYKRKKTDDKQSTHKTDSCPGNAQAPAARGTLCG